MVARKHGSITLDRITAIEVASAMIVASGAMESLPFSTTLDSLIDRIRIQLEPFTADEEKLVFVLTEGMMRDAGL